MIVQELKLCAILHFREWGPEKHDWVDFVFMSSDFQGEPQAGNEGYFKWVKKKDIKDIHLYEADHVFLPKILKGHFFVAEFHASGFHMKNMEVLTQLPLS